MIQVQNKIKTESSSESKPAAGKGKQQIPRDKPDKGKSKRKHRQPSKSGKANPSTASDEEPLCLASIGRPTESEDTKKKNSTYLYYYVSPRFFLYYFVLFCTIMSPQKNFGYILVHICTNLYCKFG